MLKSFIKKPLHTSYEGKDNDEEILYVLRRSLWVITPSTLILVFLVVIPVVLFPYLNSINSKFNLGIKPFFIDTLNIFWYLLTFGVMFQIFVNWYFNVFVITDKKIIDFDVKGLLYKNISEASLRNVEDVTSTVNGTFGTIFNIGTVSVQTAGEKREFEFNMMDHPAKIRDMISDLVSNLKGGGHNN